MRYNNTNYCLECSKSQEPFGAWPKIFYLIHMHCELTALCGGSAVNSILYIREFPFYIYVGLYAYAF